MKFRSKVGYLDKLKVHYLEVPAKTIKELGGGFKGRFVCTVNGKVTFQAGLMALGGGRGYINLSKKRMEEAGAKLGSGATVELKADKSKYGFKLPPELKELLAQDEEGNRRFHQLRPGMQRMLVYYVGLLKKSETRLERAFMIVTNLKALPEGKETFREIFGKNKA